METSDTRAYEGGELALFANAHNWKEYFRRVLVPFIREVLEVGAGIGGTTRILRTSAHRRWKCLEPDREMVGKLREMVSPLAGVEVTCGTLEDLQPEEKFDAILYIDVLEHIDDDRGELRRAAAHLKPEGTIVVLSPAHSFLFTPFDAAIGHHRRYDTASLLGAAPPSLRLERCIYLDSVGMLASLGNRLLLRQSMPTPTQIRFWDSVLVPISTRLDSLTGHRLGKSIVAIWRAAT
jgi:SAM-dependent methyltransferase